MTQASPDPQRLAAYVDALWDTQIVPELIDYVRIPNKSPMFDADWEEHGYMEQAVTLMTDWAKRQSIAGMTVEVVRLPGRTPLIFIEVPGQGEDTVLLYGHLDKQPEMTGWSEGKGPWTPVLEGERLYGRGAADDGYAIFGSLAAIAALQAQGVAHARCVVAIEACEESGSYDLPYYVDHLASRIGKPSLVVCLDSGCGNYDQMWLTTSLRGTLAGDLSVEVLSEGVHSGDASGIVPSSFRVLRQLLSRLEDADTGRIKPSQLHAEIPKQRIEQAANTATVLGEQVHARFPFVDGMQPALLDPLELILNRTWRPTLSITGIAGIPSLDQAGNVLRPGTTVKLSVRLPPPLDAATAAAFLKETLESDPPYGARVRFTTQKAGSGWQAPVLAAWLEQALDAASTAHFGLPAAYNGEGGSIPFMGMLGEKFPQAQFLITGVLGPHANAHGPNEFLHIPTGKRLTACVAEVIAAHANASRQGLTKGAAATAAHSHMGEEGCCV